MSDSHARARAIERAMKLLAMADDPAATDAERQLHAGKAAQIMARHDLTEAVVRASRDAAPEAVVLWEFTVTGSGGHGKARAYAAGAVAQAYGAQVCYRGNTSGNRPRQVCIVAHQRDVDTLAMLLPMIAAQAEYAAARATRAHLAGFTGWLAEADRRRQANAFRRSYLHAFGKGVAEQVQLRRQQVVDDLAASATGTELVLAQRDRRVAAEFTRRFPKLRRARRSRDYSPQGWARGLAEGRRAPLGGRDLPTAADRDRQVGS